MKNKDFFYLQYNKINWRNQEKTKINFAINKYIIDKVILKRERKELSIFDIGFGIGFFLKMLKTASPKNLILKLSGCEPSKLNFGYFRKNIFKILEQPINYFFEKTFLLSSIDDSFDFVTAIYVFPHFLQSELEKIIKKIYKILNPRGRFVLVLANERYLAKKLKVETDLFIENSLINYRGKRYKEILHYSDIPQIGKLIDYNREERFYLDIFKNNGFALESKRNMSDNGFVCTLFIFKKV